MSISGFVGYFRLSVAWEYVRRPRCGRKLGFVIGMSTVYHTFGDICGLLPVWVAILLFPVVGRRRCHYLWTHFSWLSQVFSWKQHIVFSYKYGLFLQKPLSAINVRKNEAQRECLHEQNDVFSSAVLWFARNRLIWEMSAQMCQVITIWVLYPVVWRYVCTDYSELCRPITKRFDGDCIMYIAN